jgi:predicted lipid-binding transport protein (Tim44 family)
MSSSLIQVIVLAGIALFLILRLKAVLGTREGFEQKPLVPAHDEPARARPQRDFGVIQGGPDADITDHVPEGSPAAKALAEMKGAEPSFGVSDFLRGARGAYEMILTAFEKGDLDEVSAFLAPDVLESFQEVIDQRKAQGLTLETTFGGIRELVLTDATFDRATRDAEVTVRFVGELTSVVRDKDGKIVEGSPTDVRKQRDVWTFGRRMGANDPNWQLIATGE